jgi:outer membrane lipoprotein
MIGKRPELRGLLLAAAIALLTSACVSIPAPLAGDYAEFQPDQATERSIGARVRWGGQIVNTRPEADRTCIEVLARELDRSLRPVAGDHHHGRFLACREGFQDPAVLAQGRDITVIGTIEGFSDGQIGEFLYRYPQLDSHTLYLWPIQPDMIMLHDPWWPYHDPWWPHRPPYRRVPRSRVSGHIIISN